MYASIQIFAYFFRIHEYIYVHCAASLRHPASLACMPYRSFIPFCALLIFVFIFLNIGRRCRFVVRRLSSHALRTHIRNSLVRVYVCIEPLFIVCFAHSFLFFVNLAFNAIRLRSVLCACAVMHWFANFNVFFILLFFSLLSFSVYCVVLFKNV